MATIKTHFNVVDNSGGISAECIKVLGKRRQYPELGSVVVLAVKKIKLKRKMKIRAHQVTYGVVTRLKKLSSRFTSFRISFDENGVVLLDKKMNPACNRIFGAVPYELRKKKHMKIVLMSQSII